MVVHLKDYWVKTKAGVLSLDASGGSYLYGSGKIL